MISYLNSKDGVNKVDKKYQIFISSTYEDLKEQRQEVLKAILKLNQIPTGMELFHASNDDQWKVIQRVIDECDYYLLIIGGRYGSLDNEGVSYTEKEFIYAKKIGKPILAFLPKNKNYVEQSEPNKNKLNDFKTSVMDGKLVAYWENKHELKSEVILALTSIMEDYPSIGWIKGDHISSEELLLENSQLRKKIVMLEEEINMISTEPPKGSEEFAHGNDKFEITYTYMKETFGIYNTETLSLTWNEIFKVISPNLVNEMAETRMKDCLNGYLLQKIKEHNKFEIGFNYRNFHIADTSFQTIKIQLVALGQIIESKKTRGVKDNDTYWTLTKYGYNLMMQLLAIRKRSANTRQKKSCRANI